MAFLQALNAGVRGGATPMAQLTASRDFAKFLSVNSMAFTHEAGIAWIMLEAVDTALGNGVNIPRVPGDQANLTCSLAPTAGAAPNAVLAYVNVAGADDQVLAEGITLNQFRTIVADAPKAIYWLLNLAACHQIKPLKASNIMNYFKMTSRVTMTGREVLKVLEFSAMTLPRIMGDQALMDMLEQNQFMTYHTSYSSTATLVEEMLASSRAVTNIMFSGETRAAVRASFEDLHDAALNAAISQQVVLATYAYLSAFNKLPDGWFQGEKAKSNLPANKYNQYLAIFKKLKLLSAGMAEIEAAGTMDALIAAIGVDMQGA